MSRMEVEQKHQRLQAADGKQRAGALGISHFTCVFAGLKDVRFNGGK